jgi:hypothetical protein
MLVLENGEFWTLYGVQTPSAFGVAGFIQGFGAINGSSFVSTNSKDFGDIPAVAITTNATFNTAARTVSGTVTDGSVTVGFSGGPIVGTTYNYDAAASLSTVVGVWTTTSLTGETVVVNIAGDGSFTAASSGGCNFTGAIAPRASGKNVFNVSTAFGASPCALPGQPASGIAVTYPLSTGPTQLIVSVIDSPRTIGTAVFGTR